MRNIKILAAFRIKVAAQSAWYIKNRDESFVKTMEANLKKDISTLASMPTIGRPYKVSNGHQYYTMPSKKKADIIYRFDDETLYIADVIFYYSKK